MKSRIISSHCWRHVVAALLIPILCGCGPEQKAPDPTINPRPHKLTKLRINVEPGSGVDNVQVYSVWIVGNRGCAPVNAISGVSVIKQVDTNEKVQKIGNYYIVTAITDRFLRGNCQWIDSGYGINLMHGPTLFGVFGVGPDDIGVSKTAEFSCMPPPIAVCDSIRFDKFDRNRFKKVFNVTVEIER